MERIHESLQQILSDAQDIQHIIQACNPIQNEELNAQEHERKCEQEIVDWNFKHRIDDIIRSREASNGNNFAKNCIPLVERRDVDLAYDLSHDKRGTYNFMHLFVDSQEDEFANQFVEEHVDVPEFFLLDDIAYATDLPIYDEYDDNCDDESLEKPTACPLSEFFFQQCNEMTQPTYHSYKEESVELAEGNYLPLFFSSFRLLKENPKIIIEESKYVRMKNHAKLMNQKDKVSQHSCCVPENPITCAEIQPSIGDKIEDSFKSCRTTLPLCFSSFELLKENICSISGQESSKHERSGDDNIMNNHIKGHVSSNLQSMFSYQPEKEEEVAPESIVQGHFLSPEINIDSRHEKVFQSIFSSLENDVVVQFLNNIDMDEDSETASMEVSNNKIKKMT
jgi:hypothetical protein